MLHDLDRTISGLLRGELDARGVTNVAISFAAPDDRFPPMEVVLPAVSFFLYDIRENLGLRSNDYEVDVVGGGGNGGRATATRRRPPVRVDCSYLITAWAGEGVMDAAAEEHRLLGEVMRALLRHRSFPETALQGELADQRPPLRARLLAENQLQSLGELWQAMGGKPKAALHYGVTISLDVQEPEAVHVAEHFRFDIHTTGVTPAAAEQFAFDAPERVDEPSES
jgi:hypothetical protein